MEVSNTKFYNFSMSRQIKYDYNQQPDLRCFNSESILEPLPDHVLKIYNNFFLSHPFFSNFSPREFCYYLTEEIAVFDYDQIALHIIFDSEKNIESLSIQEFGEINVPYIYNLTEFNNIDKAMKELAYRLSKIAKLFPFRLPDGTIFYEKELESIPEDY